MKIPSASLAPRTSITPDNKADAITITAWATLVTLVLMFLAREAIKFRVLRKFAIDDLLILFATVFAIGLSITALILASDGLGVFGTLTLRRANTLMKGIYASEFLYVSALGLAKLSLVTFFYGIHIQRAQRRFVLWFGFFILAWTLASLVAVAFQCRLPKPWESFTLRCYNGGAFWIVYCIIDMTTDVSIIMLSVNLVAYLKVRLSRKIAVIACFAPRVLVIGASLARLIYLYPITPHDNPAFNLWIPVICAQVQACLSISTACIPYMKPFFENSETGVWRAESVRKRATMDDSYGCSSLTGCLKGNKRKALGNSMDSTAATSLKHTRTSDVSPRIPSPPPLSPLTTPRFITPPNSSASSSRSPSERGLRLHIPAAPEIHVRRPSAVMTPQTASSHALSPECLSPQPLLSPPSHNVSPKHRRREPSPPPASRSPRGQVSSSHYGSPEPSIPSPSRFSLFPQQHTPRYSLIPQQYAHANAHPQPSIPPTLSEHWRSGNRTPAANVSMRRTTTYVTPETRTPSSGRDFRGPHHHHLPPRTSSLATGPYGLTTTPYEDPMRTREPAVAITTTVPVPAPVDAHTSIPSYYVKTPPTAHGSSFSPPQPLPSYYIATPPSAHPPTFPLPARPSSQPYQAYSQPYEAVPIPAVPTSPQRQRNQRILTPRNSSRRDQMSPVSPVSPPTPLTFWRDESSSESAGTQRGRVQHPWAEDERMPVLRDVRSSPRIVAQRLS